MNVSDVLHVYILSRMNNRTYHLYLSEWYNFNAINIRYPYINFCREICNLFARALETARRVEP